MNQKTYADIMRACAFVHHSCCTLHATHVFSLTHYKHIYSLTHALKHAHRYRNKALGSDYEDEVVLQAVAADDIDDPYAVLMRNAQHEAKVKDWQGMSAQQK